MKFALLGADPEALELARGVAADHRHQLVWASDWGPFRRDVERFAPTARFEHAWESLLVSDDIDAVIVASSADVDAAADRLRKLVQSGKPLLVSHPVHPSMLIGYELDMIRQETRSPILPYAPTRWHPAVRRLAALFGAEPTAPLGQLEQVIIERRLADRSAENVRKHFARDVGLARLLGGELTRLSAMAPTSAPSGYASLGVQLSGPANVLIRYSVLPVEREAAARVTAIGGGGKAELLMPAEGDWSLAWGESDVQPPESFPDWDPAAAALDQFARLLAGEVAHPTWVDACRDIELADSIQRSLDKGRTVELHYEDYTEDGTFKGTMTSLGCALLWLAPLVLLVGIVLGQMGLPIADYVPHMLLGVLGIFLLLQLLRLAVPSKSP
ncbi:MAG: hypothetical protein JNG90_12760 [Planctomycetaceae bacterium]|nr:hypothetical protein [Planctomycetaceae bacterium]